MAQELDTQFHLARGKTSKTVFSCGFSYDFLFYFLGWMLVTFTL